ncbi:MAG: hypothetical protein IJH13_01415 [Bacilli bacterium]|nr:hypothetical protein [Bacilli bacterium]
MKQPKLLLVLLIISGTFLIILGKAITANAVVEDLKVHKISGLNISKKDYPISNWGHQSMVFTGKYLAIYANNKNADNYEGIIHVFKRNSSGTWVKYFSTEKETYTTSSGTESTRALRYSHGNDMTYIKDTNEIAILYYIYDDNDDPIYRVVYIDASSLDSKKWKRKRIKKLDQTNTLTKQYVSMAYDASLKRFYLGGKRSGVFKYTVCDGEISDAKCTVDVFGTTLSGATGGCSAAKGYLYQSSNIGAQSNGKDTRDGRIYVFHYMGGDYKSSSSYEYVKGWKILPGSDFTTSGDIIEVPGETESVELNTESGRAYRPWILFHNPGKKNKNTNAYTQNSSYSAWVLTPDFTAKDPKASIVTKVSTNNQTGFDNLGMQATITSSSPSTNKTVTAVNNKYSYSGPASTTIGNYTFNIKQASKTAPNWTFDQSTKKATVAVEYSLATNNLISSTTFANGDNTFTNTYNYSAVSVPLSVNVQTTKTYSGLDTPSTSASLYKDNQKVGTVSASENKYSFSDVQISQEGTYTYTIKQDNSGQTTSGNITTDIDSSNITATITATKSASGLECSVKYSKSTFTNKVSADFPEVNNKVEINIKTDKHQTSVTPNTSATLYKSGVVIETKSNASDKYTFNIKVTEPGTYRYTIAQDTSITGNGNYSYELDDKTITLTIVATVENNNLVSTYSLSSNTFTNKVSYSYDNINIPIHTKIVTIKSLDTIPTPNTQATVVIGGNEENISNEGEYYNYTFRTNEPGVYKYIITQKNLDNDEYMYDIDDKRITYTIEVTDNNGTLQYTINPTSAQFNNEVSTSESINFSVQINTSVSNSEIETPVSSATLYRNNASLAQANSRSRKYTFNDIEITSPGEYVYTIKQDKNGKETIGNIDYYYDSKEIEVHVTATEGEGRLWLDISYSANVFENSITQNYDPISVPISLTIDNIKDNESLSVAETSAAIYQGDNKLQTVTSANEKYDFSVQIAKAGTYIYSIRQNNPGIHKEPTYSYTIDGDSKIVNVEVYEEDNVLKYRKSFRYGDSTFENYYMKGFDAIAVPIEVNIVNDAPNPNINIPVTRASIYRDKEKIETVNSASNKYTFTPVEFLTEGEYDYQIKQEGYTSHINDTYEINMDDSEINVHISVFAEGGKLKHNITYDSTEFNNKIIAHYTAVDVPLEVSIIDNYQGEEPIKSRAVLATNDKVLNTMENEESKYKSSVSVDDTGTYTYKLYQQQPYHKTENNLVQDLDDKTITATIDVTDNNGALSYNVRYDSNSFNNNYTPTEAPNDPFVNVPVNINMFSNSGDIKDLNMQATLFENNIPIETVASESMGYAFKTLLLAPGEYTYQVKQNEVESDNWYIDDQIIEVTITVNDDLTYSLAFKDDISSFTNTNVDVVDPTEEDEVIPDDKENDSNNKGNRGRYENPLTLSDVPDTASFASIVLKFLGVILILGGLYIWVLVSNHHFVTKNDV